MRWACLNISLSEQGTQEMRGVVLRTSYTKKYYAHQVGEVDLMSARIRVYSLGERFKHSFLYFNATLVCC